MMGDVADDPVVVRTSPVDFAATVARLIATVEAHGARVFAVIDHARAAADAGFEMPPTSVVVFGNPAVGTPLMLLAPDLAVDLPSRVLVRQAGDAVEIVYTPPAVVAARYGIPIRKAGALAGLVSIIDDALADGGR